MHVIKKYQVELVKESSKKYEVDRKVNNPEKAYQAFEAIFNLSSRPAESIVLLALDTKLGIVGAFEVSTGAINYTVADARGIFQRLLLCNAHSFMIAHNHPSGDCQPSMEDNRLTLNLKGAGKLLGIELREHIVIGDDSYYSYAEEGKL